MALDIIEFSTADYLADTQHLTLAQHGAYTLILWTMWRHGGWLPDDDKTLARICKTSTTNWRKMSTVIRALLLSQDGKLSQKRLLSEAERSLAEHQKRVLAGKAGGHAKALKNQESPPSSASILLESDLIRPLSDSNIEKKEEVRGGKQEARRGTRLSLEWRAGEKGYAYAAKHGFDARDAATNERAFINHYTVGPGRNKTWINWDTCFQDWIRREVGFRSRRNGGNGYGKDESRSLIAAGRRLSEKLEHSRRSGDVGRAQERNGGARDAASDIDVRLLPER